jgi:glycosyltransferase involved in cell wall biosynthesis
MGDLKSAPALVKRRSLCATPQAALEPDPQPPIICFSHLRWNFVFQRPQHLMTRAARGRQVFFWEEPLLAEEGGPSSQPELQMQKAEQGVTVVTPLLPSGMTGAAALQAQRALLNELVQTQQLGDAVLWYYTPAALLFSDHLTTQHPVVYDCMDELSVFLGADPSLPNVERLLLDRADVVFTGGYSLYEAKRHQHHNVHPLPSGVDLEHFRPARRGLPEPADQQHISHPRLGFYGVIDERLDTGLIVNLAALRPNWQIILVGPVVKVDPASLPQAANIHYLGGKKYEELPAYLSGWDVALMPFALNDATRFISPTKTPEYLAGGKPIVSTPVFDVVRHYGRAPGVRIADGAAAFVAAVEDVLRLSAEPDMWLPAADEMLAKASWNGIWSRMSALIRQSAAPRGLGAGNQARASLA